MSNPPPVTPTESPAATPQDPREQDASFKEILLYAFGNIEGAIANQFFSVLQSIMVVAMLVNPLLIGAVLAIKTLWDSVTDPVMAYITDNTRSRWGRRRPYILVGGCLRIAMLVGVVAFFPWSEKTLSNEQLEANKQASESLKAAGEAEKAAVALYQDATDGSVPDDAIERAQRLVAEADSALAKTDAVLGLMQRTWQQRQEWLDQGVANRAASGFNPEAAEEIRKVDADRAKRAKDEVAKAENAVATARRARLLATAVAQPEAAPAASATVLAVQQVLTRSDAAKGLLAEAVAIHAATETGRTREAATMQSLADRRGELAGVLGAAQATLAAATADADAGVSEEVLAATRGKLERATTQLEQAETIIVAAQAVASGTVHDQARARAIIADLAAAAEKAVAAKQKKGAFESITAGFEAFFNPGYADQQRIIIYVLLVMLLFTTLTTVQSVPYYALGIEMCPSYHGRTRVVAWRSAVDKLGGLVAPAVPWFCFLPLFVYAVDGLLWVAILACAIGIPSTVIMCIWVKERTQVQSRKGGGNRIGFVKSMWITVKNRHFLRIFALYTFIGFTNGLFAQIGFYLNVYWVMGSALAGAQMGFYIGMIAWGLGFLTLPIITWACKRFGKHRTLRYALVLMSVGTALKWWAMDPEHPYYQLILPFFFSVGISSVYTVLPTMMADVTDVDELNTGSRREGMFGAMMAFLMKMTGTFIPLLAGAVLVASGFDPVLEHAQDPQTILNMRILYSLVPAFLLLFALFLLWRYPLTEAKMVEIKEELGRRRAAAAAAE